MRIRANIMIIVIVLLLISVSVNVAASQSQIPKEVMLNLLEYHMCRVPPEVSYIGPEPRDLFYVLHFQLQNREIDTILHDVKINITDIVDFPIDLKTGKPMPDCWLSPYPTSFGENWLYWYVGDLKGSEKFWDWFHLFWEDKGRIYKESLGFSALRSFEPKEIPADKDSIIQTVTIEIRPIEKDKVLHAGIEYRQELISAKLLEYNYEEYVIIPSPIRPSLHEIEWSVMPPLEDVYVFSAKFELSRKTNVTGPIEVIPGNRADLRVVTKVPGYETNIVNASLKDGIAKVTTTDTVYWNIAYESPSRTVFFDSCEKAKVNNGVVKLAESHWIDISPETQYIGSDEIIRTYYRFAFHAWCEKGVLKDLIANITDIIDMPTEIKGVPEPIKGDNWMAWKYGDIKSGGEIPSLEWFDRDRVFDESLGFSVFRKVDPVEIPFNVDVQLQEVVLEVTPTISERSLGICIDYEEKLVQARIVDYEAPVETKVRIYEDLIDFHISSPEINTNYRFVVKYELTRGNVKGDIKVMPRTWVRLEKYEEKRATNILSISEKIEVATITISTSNPVNWLIWHWHGVSKTLEFHSVEETVIAEGRMYVDKHYWHFAKGYSTENTELVFEQEWGVCIHNYGKHKLPFAHVNVTVVPDGFTIVKANPSWTKVVESKYVWELGDIEPGAEQRINIWEAPSHVTIKPGFVSSRNADIEIFTEPGYQTLTAILTSEESFSYVKMGPTIGQIIETDLVKATVIETTYTMWDKNGNLKSGPVKQPFELYPPEVEPGDKIVAIIKFYVEPKVKPIRFLGPITFCAERRIVYGITEGYTTSVTLVDTLGEKLTATLETSTYSRIFTDTHCGHAVVYNPIVQLVATIDIDSDTINLKSKGKWITCYIELPNGYDVNNIDIKSIRLTVAGKDFPVDSESPIAIGDYDNDGIPDLMVKFNKASIRDWLGGVDGKDIEFIVSGFVGEGVEFIGSDIIRIISSEE